MQAHKIIMKKQFLKHVIKLIIINIFILSIMSIIQNEKAYSHWYEEPETYETENIDSMWWLTKSKKEKLKTEQQKEIEKKRQENLFKNIKDKNIKWIYDSLDITNFPKNKWEIIDDDFDGIGYKYYFDKDGYLLMDTITPDYKIVDTKGREVDINLKPIQYEMSNLDSSIVIEELEVYIPPESEQAKIILGEGVVLKNKEKIYDNSINKDLLNYIDKSDRFMKTTYGTVDKRITWKKCSSLKGNGGYVVFNNPKNNFNKISGFIASDYEIDDNNTVLTLKVYDAEIYDKLEKAYRLYEIEEIYKNYNFSEKGIVKFQFIFDRSIKKLKFVIESEGEYKNETCYLKDLKFGFSKKAFYDELIRKEEEEEIEELKRLGIYVEDMWNFDLIDEDGDNIEEDEEETENENNDDRIGGISYVSDEETRNYEDVVRDRSNGPAFDKELQNGTTWRNFGPAFTNIP